MRRWTHAVLYSPLQGIACYDGDLMADVTPPPLSLARTIVLYDGSCGLCRRGALTLQRLDWFHALSIRDFYRAPAVLAERIDPAAFAEGIPVLTRDGRLLIGFEGLRHAFLATPVGMLVGWVLLIPGISYLARRRYRHIAQTRHAPSCSVSGACAQ